MVLKKMFFLIILFNLSLPFLSFSQDDGWWETLKSYEEKFKKMTEDLQREYERAKYLQDKKGKREKMEKKVSSEYQKKAMKEVTRFLKEKIGNAKGAEFIDKMYKNGSIVWGDEDSFLLGKITLDKNHLYSLYDNNFNINFHNLAKLATTIIHESIHSGQWGAYFGMTSNANEEQAYFGTLSAIALWLAQTEKRMEDQKSKDPCKGLEASQELNDLVNVLNYYDSTIYEKSLENREKLSKSKEKESIEVQNLYEKRAKAERYISQLELYQSFIQDGLKKIDLRENEKKELFERFGKIKKTKDGWDKSLKNIKEEIQKKETLIKTYETQLNEPALDITKFSWTDEKGNKYNRDKLLALAKEKEKKAKEVSSILSKECEEKKKIKEKEKEKIAKIIPPSIKTNKDKFYNCLCRCGIPADVWGGYYPDPIPNSSPSCEKSGICASGNWGCLRFYPPTEGECFSSCAKNTGYDSEVAKKEIKEVMEKDLEDLLKKAREIMEEYLPSIPKIGKHFFEEKGNILYASISSNYLSDTKILYDIKPLPKAKNYVEKIKEKNKRKDPEMVLSLIEEAEKILPEKKNSGETMNLRAEFAIILAKASLNIIPDLEFDEGIYMLENALKIYKLKIDNTISKEIKDLLGSFKKWKIAWKILSEETPKCINMIKNKEVCKCDELYQLKIYPSIKDLTIYVSSSEDKWKISKSGGNPRKIPQKEKLEKEIKEELQKGKIQCEKNPVFLTKEWHNLKNYYSYKQLEGSQYTNKENLKRDSAPVLCGVNALKTAENILSNPNLCDCQRNELNKIIEIAKKDGTPMVADFSVNPREIKFGERVMINLKIQGGTPPFEKELKGSYKINKYSDSSRGFNVNWKPEKTGNLCFNVNVKDSCGEIFKKDGCVYVKKEEIKNPEKIVEYKEEKKIEIKEKSELKKGIKKENEKEKKEEKIKTIEKEFPKIIDLNGKWIANCGAEDMDSTIIHKGNSMELKIEDSSYKGNLYGNNINLKSSDGTEKISGTIVNENEIKIKVIDKNYPQKPGNCIFTRKGNFKQEIKKEEILQKEKLEALVENRSSGNIHIFVEGQDSFGPHNRIAPKEKIKIKFNPSDKNNIIKFIAGRNGQKIAECKWEYDGNSSSRYPVVVYDEKNPFEKLSCKTGLK